MSRWYLPIRSLVILIIVLLMLVGLVSIILSVIAVTIVNSGSPAVGYTWFNDLKCPTDGCPVPADDTLWENTKGVEIQKEYQGDVARRCADLVARVINAEKTSKITSPPSLTLQGEFYNHPQDPTFGALWTDNSKNAWLAFRGTLSNTLREWQNDFTYNQESLPASKFKSAALQKTFMVQGSTDEAPSVHAGFLDVYNMFKSDLLAALKNLQIERIIVTGHSLGGGVSTLCAVDLASTYPVVSYTFAAPRTGDERLCKLIDERLSIYRIVNTSDVVPTLPPSVCPNFNSPKDPFLYQQCGIAMIFTLNWKSVVNNHELAVYIAGLKNILS